MAFAMIEVEKLTKIYPSGKGIFDVDFAVAKGEVFGFLGPNGAGKTTTIRNLLGFLTPKSGRCAIAGLDCRRDAATIQRTLGYVPGEIAFFDRMTGTQFLKFIGEMRVLKDFTLQKRLIQRFELETAHPIRKMSKGMKQKLGLIAALMHDPAVIILDEPTSGLDPLMQQRFVELIKEEQGRGKTILLSSHIFDEIDKTCTRAAIIRDGRIVATQDITSLKANLRKTFEVTVESEADMERLTGSGLELEVTGERQANIHIGKDYTPMLRVLAQCKVKSLRSAAQTLEQTFMSFYGKERD